MGSLDDAVTLKPAGSGRWKAYADPDHESMNGMFGGWTSAVSLAAVIASGRADLRPSALTINYLSVVTPRTAPVVHVEHLGGSRSIDHWRADLRTSEDGDLQASASVVLTARRPTEAHDQWTMPEAPDPGTLREFHAPGTQGRQTDIRRLSGDEEQYVTERVGGGRGIVAHVEKRSEEEKIAEQLIKSDVNILFGGRKVFFLPEAEKG